MLKLKKVNDLAILPQRAYPTDSGLDLFSVENAILKPNEAKAIDIGWQMAIPEGYEIQIRPRSGLALKNITVNNSPGTIDHGFSGNVKVILINLGKSDYSVSIGSKIAQMVINKIELWNPAVVANLDSTDRGANGFGSTGV